MRRSVRESAPNFKPIFPFSSHSPRRTARSCTGSRAAIEMFVFERRTSGRREPSVQPLELDPELAFDPVELFVQLRDLHLGLDVDLVVRLAADAVPRAACRFLRIMMTGACSAASSESRRFSRMNGNGSNVRRVATLKTIHAHMKLRNRMMNRQLPPNEATRSAMRSPSVNCVAISSFGFLNPIFQERVGPADSLRERREHVERRVRLAPEEIEKFVPLQDERFDVAQSVRRRRPVPSVEEPELAEQLARLQHVDDELFSHFVDDGGSTPPFAARSTFRRDPARGRSARRRRNALRR